MKTITEERLENFKLWLRNDVRANEGTVNQYIDKLGTLEEFLGDGEITKESLEAFKSWLVEDRHYKKSSANTFLFAVRGFCRAMDWEPEVTVTAYSVEPTLFNDGGRYISRADYQKLVSTALYLEDYRMVMMIQTLCHMDLRFSEMGLLTVEAVREGKISITRRKHTREMKIPDYLQESLMAYSSQTGIEEGILFRTPVGNPIDRSNMWRNLKQLCRLAGVDEERVTLQKLKMPRMHDYYPFYPVVDCSMEDKL